MKETIWVVLLCSQPCEIIPLNICQLDYIMSGKKGLYIYKIYICFCVCVSASMWAYLCVCLCVNVCMWLWVCVFAYRARTGVHHIPGGHFYTTRFNILGDCVLHHVADSGN